MLLGLLAKIECKKGFSKDNTNVIKSEMKSIIEPVFGSTRLLLKCNCRHLSFAVVFDLTHPTPLDNSAQRSASTVPHKLEADPEENMQAQA